MIWCVAAFAVFCLWLAGYWRERALRAEWLLRQGMRLELVEEDGT